MTEHYTPTAQRDAVGRILTVTGIVTGFLAVVIIVAADPAQLLDPAAPRAEWLPQSDTFWVVAPLIAILLVARLARRWLGCSFVAGFLAGGYLACAVAAAGVLLLEIL